MDDEFTNSALLGEDGQTAEFLVQRSLPKNAFEIYLRTKYAGVGWAYATNLVMHSDGVNDFMPKSPLVSISPSVAQGLMDELWNAGVRPTEVGGPGELKATQKHLEDMRKIAFSYIDLAK